jgi:hypothetical protein
MNDIFESMGIKEQMGEASQKTLENLSDSEREFFRKMHFIANYRNSIYLQRVIKENVEGYVEFNVFNNFKFRQIWLDFVKTNAWIRMQKILLPMRKIV